MYVSLICTTKGLVQLTSVFKDRPLLKKIVETAMYFTVISGLRGPAAYKYIAYLWSDLIVDSASIEVFITMSLSFSQEIGLVAPWHI